MRSLLLAAVIAVGLPVSAAAEESATDKLDQAMQNVLDAIKLMMLAVPQYELPEVLPNGDIIIRRVRPEDAPGNGPDRGPEPGPGGEPPAGQEDSGEGVKT